MASETRSTKRRYEKRARPAQEQATRSRVIDAANAQHGTVGTEPLPPGARIGIEAFDAAGASLGAAAPGYGWEPWQRVTWHERRKAGWATLRDAFAEAVR